jgi:hypothetical protein
MRYALCDDELRLIYFLRTWRPLLALSPWFELPHHPEPVDGSKGVFAREFFFSFSAMPSALCCSLVCDNLRESAVKCILFVVVDSREKWNVPFLSVCQWFIALSHKSRPDTNANVTFSRQNDRPIICVRPR